MKCENQSLISEKTSCSTVESQQTQPTEGPKSNLCHIGGRQVLLQLGCYCCHCFDLRTNIYVESKSSRYNKNYNNFALSSTLLTTVPRYCISLVSKIQLAVYHQCCVLIG
mgnify:CR=1 FL=1